MTEPGDLSRRNEGIFDSRTFFAVMLSLAIWYGWLALFPPEATPAGPEEPGEVAAAPAAVSAAGSAAPEVAVQVEEKEIPVELCGSKAVLSTSRGAIRSLELAGVSDRYHTQTLLQWVLTPFSGPWLPYGEEPGPVRPLSPSAEAVVAGVGQVGGSCRGGPCDVAPGVVVDEVKPGRLVTTGRTADGVEVRRVLQEVAGEPCRVDVEITWRNTGTSTLQGMWVGMHDTVEPTTGQYEVGFHPIVAVDGEVEEYSDPAEMPNEGAPLETPTDWFGVANTYFAAVLAPVASTEQSGRLVWSRRGEGPGVLAGSNYVIDRSLAPGAEHVERLILYAGNKRLADLGAVDGRLTSLVQLGFFSFFALPLLYLLGWLHSVLGNWAASIVALTFIVKALFFRLSQQSYVSSQQMQAIQPEIEKLRAEFKDNQDELNKRMMLLFRERGVNPAAGCLPILVQMPVWIALYSVLQTSVELYHAPFLYIRDLTAVDPYMVMPTVVVVLMVIQQRQMPTGNMDPQQAQIMRWMPLIFGLLFFSLPAGLLLYIFVNMVLSIAQQSYIKNTYKPQTTAPISPGG